MSLRCDLSGSGAPLLLLYGALVSRAMWQPQINEFSRCYQVIACDLPAHGESPDVAGPYTVAEVSRRVAEVLDALSIQRAHVCGHSLGGMVAQQLALTWPDRVDRLVLAETAFGTRSTAWERLQTALARLFCA